MERKLPKKHPDTGEKLTWFESKLIGSNVNRVTTIRTNENCSAYFPLSTNSTQPDKRIDKKELEISYPLWPKK